MSCQTAVCGPDLPCEPCTIDILIARGTWDTERQRAIWRNVTPEDIAPELADQPRGTGTGSGRSLGRGFRPATEKQIAFLIHLATELGTLNELAESELAVGLSSAEASELIDLAKAELDRRPAPAAAVPVARWKKHQGAWVLVATGATTGDTITVRRSSGEEREVTLGAEVAPGMFEEARARKAPRDPNGGARVELIAGRVYATADGTVVRVQESRTSGKLYGKVWQDGSFEYAAGALRDIVRPLTLEEAAAFGHETGRCCVCARELTDPASIAAGIGPVCAGRFA